MMHSLTVRTSYVSSSTSFDTTSVDVFFNFLIAGHKEIFYEMQLAIVKAGLIGGYVYLAEDASGAAIGGTVWFGPGHELLDSFVCIDIPSFDVSMLICSYSEEQHNAGFNKFMENLAKKEPSMTSWWMEYVSSEW